MSQIVILAADCPEVAALQSRLRTAGLDVVHFPNQSAVLARLSRMHIDLLILSDGDSIEDVVALYDRLRKLPGLSKVPCLLLARFSSPEEQYAMSSAVGTQGTIHRDWPPALMVAWVLKTLSGKVPTLPVGESQRMKTVRATKILDTPREPVFDDLTQVASIVCQTPIAVVSVVAEQRQWFKSRIGLDAEQTPRDQAFCAHAIHSSDLMEVADATLDPRFLENPLVTGEPRIRFYAGSPLVMSDGQALGTLCVIDRKPRRLTGEQRTALLALGRVVSHLLDTRRQSRTVATEIAESDVRQSGRGISGLSRSTR